MSERPGLQNLTVKGDLIVKPETRDGKLLHFFRMSFDANLRTPQ